MRAEEPFLILSKPQLAPPGAAMGAKIGHGRTARQSLIIT
jgi:hypothetical protein